MTMTTLLLADMLERTARAVEAELNVLLPPQTGAHARVVEAMRYAALAGGKRLRPFLLLEAAALFDAPKAGALRAAVALEMVHTYSLVHDDLPAMDDDDLRRGRPTTHLQFDEATAILAGDGLLTLAFEVLADAATHADAAVRCALVAGLARAAGPLGMVGGQMIDLQGATAPDDLAGITRLQEMKTGALIRYALAAGAMLGGAAQAERLALDAYGRDIGLAFPIADDIVDVEGSARDLGKRTGKDAGLGKATFLSSLGLEAARQKAATLSRDAVNRLDLFGERADSLRAVARFVVDRRV
jgi:farnesyl diphosphate synthase